MGNDDPLSPGLRSAERSAITKATLDGPSRYPRSLAVDQCFPRFFSAATWLRRPGDTRTAMLKLAELEAAANGAEVVTKKGAERASS